MTIPFIFLIAKFLFFFTISNIDEYPVCVCSIYSNWPNDDDMFDRGKRVTVIVQQRGLPPQRERNCIMVIKRTSCISRKLRKWLQDTLMCMHLGIR